ncbi:hypothetical protein G6K92_33320, partial [Agrobacterium rhizogenes]|nr:hypothetical protein [Rhizobium rhizogenes]NTH68909.1 hypothetical protein [Rhizobium rhizogenes]NTI00369.1 hypothetical protein [Rhizobium rhizogenes]
SLPEYMVPAAVVALEALPLTPNGKLDRRKLPAPTFKKHFEAVSASTDNQWEDTIRVIWATALKQADISSSDNFYDVGGDSLTAIKVLNTIRDKFPHTVSQVRLSDITTPSELARKVRGNSQARTNAPRLTIIPPRMRQNSYPVSLSQAQVWFLSELVPNAKAYNFQAIFHLKGNLDIEHLESSLTHVVAQNEIFWTKFFEEDGEPLQRVLKPWKVKLDLLDLNHLSAPQRQFAYDEVVKSIVETKFDPGRPPLVKWKLVRLEKDVYALLHVEHHYVHDGWSFRLFLRQLSEAYSQKAHSQSTTVSDVRPQMIDYCVWQQEWLRSPEANVQASFWKNHLRNYQPKTILPFQKKQATKLNFTGGMSELHIDAELLRQLRRKASEKKATLFESMLGIFAYMIGNNMTSDEFIIGTAVANRNHEQLESIIGMIVNMLPLRFQQVSCRCQESAITATATQVRDCLQNADYPFPLIVRDFNPRRSADTLPLIQIAFNFHNSLTKIARFSDLVVEVDEGLPNGSAKFALNVTAKIDEQLSGGNAIIMFEFNSDIYGDEDIESLKSIYHGLLEQWCALK